MGGGLRGVPVFVDIRIMVGQKPIFGVIGRFPNLLVDLSPALKKLLYFFAEKLLMRLA